MISDADKQVRTRSIEAIADRVALLATRSELGDKTNYQQFEKLRAALGQLGLGTDQSLVSEVARSFFEGAPKVRLIFLRPGRLDNAITWSKEFSTEIVRGKIAGCRLILMGEKLRPITGASHELADPERVVLHVPPGVEFPGATQAGYYFVADLHPSQISMP